MRSIAVIAAGLVLLAPPAYAAVPAAGQVSAAEQQTILALHNQYRAAAGVAALVWDDQLAADAQTWADALVQRSGKLDHANPADPNDPGTSGAKGEGENLAGGQSAATAPTQWYAEKAAFDAARDKSGFSDANPDWVNWGHYTQMMWSGTTRIGCGTAPGPRFQITSCRYSPPGNVDGQLAYPGAGTMQVPAVTTPTDAGAAPVVPAPAPVADPPAPAAEPAPADPAPADPAPPAANEPPADGTAPTGNGDNDGTTPG